MGTAIGALIGGVLLAPLYGIAKALVETAFELVGLSFKAAGDGSIPAIVFCVVLVIAVLCLAREFIFGCLGCLGTVVLIIVLIALF